MSKRRGLDYWQEHLDAWHQSDLTQEAYCADHGLSVKSFYRWRRKQKESIAAGKPLTLVPVSVGGWAAQDVVRLRSPGGWRIEVPACGYVSGACIEATSLGPRRTQWCAPCLPRNGNGSSAALIGSVWMLQHRRTGGCESPAKITPANGMKSC